MSTAQDLLARIQQQNEEIKAIQQYWGHVFPEFDQPDKRQCQVWLKFYTFDQVVGGLETANARYATRQNTGTGPMDRTQVLAYASGVMKGLKRKAEDGR